MEHGRQSRATVSCHQPAPAAGLRPASEGSDRPDAHVRAGQSRRVLVRQACKAAGSTASTPPCAREYLPRKCSCAASLGSRTGTGRTGRPLQGKARAAGSAGHYTGRADRPRAWRERGGPAASGRRAGSCCLANTCGHRPGPRAGQQPSPVHADPTGAGRAAGLVLTLHRGAHGQPVSKGVPLAAAGPGQLCGRLRGQQGTHLCWSEGAVGAWPCWLLAPRVTCTRRCRGAP